MAQQKEVQVRKTSSGHWEVTVSRYRKPMKATITDSELIDKYNQLRPQRERGFGKVCQQLYDQVIWRSGK